MAIKTVFMFFMLGISLMWIQVGDIAKAKQAVHPMNFSANKTAATKSELQIVGNVKGEWLLMENDKPDRYERHGDQQAGR